MLAFLVGAAPSGPLVGQTHRPLGPLPDFLAAPFFLFFGPQIDPATLPRFWAGRLPWRF